MPLSFSNIGETFVISRISGSGAIRKHLTDLGFIAGEEVSVISKVGDGNLIVKVKGARIALDKMLACKIFV